MKHSLLLAELTREEARSIAAETLAVLPIGAVEQHGPHLPVGTDFLTIDHLAREAAARAAEEISVVVTPTMPFGSSHHHLPFGGTMSLSTQTCYQVLCDLAESLVTSGFRSIFILNGHGGNHEVAQLTARDLALKHQAHLAAASYWTIAWDALIEEGAHLAGRLPGHSGAYETSQMLALRPDLVRQPLPSRAGASGSNPRSFNRPYRAERPGFWQSIEGYSDSPDRADAERGRVYLDAVVRSVANAMVEFHKGSR